MSARRATFQAPPATAGGTRRPAYDYAAVAATLRARPGEWMKLEDLPAPVAVRIRTGKVAAFRPAGAWEATTRTNGYARGRVDIYVRFTGPEAARA